MNVIRIYVQKDDRPIRVAEAIARIYPNVKRENPRVEIHLTFNREIDIDEVNAVLTAIKKSAVLDSKDVIYYDYI